MNGTCQRPGVKQRRANRGCNPELLAEGRPAINRPHKLLALPDGKTIILSGTPDYGVTGGGLLFWDNEARKAQLLKDTDILPDHSTMSLVAIPGDRLLGGTTTAPGTGGINKAKEAQLYLMDLGAKKLLWHQALLPGVQEYTDLCVGPNGLIYGIADRIQFFVFDVKLRKVIVTRNLTKFGATAYGQGPRVFVRGPGGKVYVLFNKGIARVEPKTHTITWLADSPVPITVGGTILTDRYILAAVRTFTATR